MYHLSWLLSPVLFLAPPSSGPATTPRLPGGVADSQGRTGFVSNAAGGLDALDLATGDLLWQSDEAQVALVVAGDRLYAQAGCKQKLTVVTLDVKKKGALLADSDPVVLPPWVSINPAPGKSFKVRGRVEGGKLVLVWEARAWFTGGARPTAEVEAAARKQAAGTARVDLATGGVEMQSSDNFSPPRPPVDLQKLAVRWQGVTGDHYSALVLEESAGRQHLVLRSWDLASGKDRPSRELLQGKRLLVQVTPDERYLCLRGVAPSPEQKVDPEDRKNLDWTLVEAETGKAIGKAPYVPGTQEVALVGQRVYYALANSIPGPIDRPFVQPRTLRALDLVTGKTLWERPVKGKTFTPPPP